MKESAVAVVKRRGGPRPGSGRKSHYGEPLTASVPVRLSAEQLGALHQYCAKKRLHLGAMLRETALAAAGARQLGKGLEYFCGQAGTVLPPARASRYVLPVLMTPHQYSAVEAAAKQADSPVGALVRDSALRAVGRKDLIGSAPRSEE